MDKQKLERLIKQSGEESAQSVRRSNQPRKPKSNTRSVAELVLIDYGEFQDATLSDEEFIGKQAHSISLERVVFRKMRLNGSTFDRLRLTDARVETCDLSNVQWLKVTANRIDITDSKMIGTRIIDSRISNALFDNCKADGSQFQGTEFKSVLFRTTIFANSDFRHTDLRNTIFDRCDLSGAEMYGAKLEGADLRGSKLDGLKVNAEDLKGAIIDSQQLLDMARFFAGLLNVRLKDDG